ncbi:hypothetical protein NQ315_008854 [Exocentrus adspersus]|uniref:Probable RNA-binding protein EIF1AD n=1 Tax=Exocentrus adspersus TaxID=1586481 RepID=A0AAV8VDN0_9CUCU|nr:hypothetical protein NQ315_008854 [Exocentrus adspersus]
MSRSSVRKQVMIEVLQDDQSLPAENQRIVRVLKSRGNNLHEVENPDKSILLASMPRRFRCGVWVKKGDFVLVEPIEEGNKVKAEIVKILSTEQIKYYKMNNVWPEEFSDVVGDKKTDKKDSDDEIFVNPNRPRVSDSGSNESSDSDSSDAEEEDDYDGGDSDSASDPVDSSSKKC